MSFILAIEPDPRQSTQLRDLVRRRLSAELVHAPTTEGALAALAKIGDRVPDLVLVPSLLSPQEDAAIAGALRIIAAAANVRMLTIPLLADPAQRAKPPGMLARLRGKKAKTTPGGCHPDVFADQIADYLAEAAAERKALREELEDDDLAALAPTPCLAEGPIGATAIERAVVVPQPLYKPLIIQPVVVAAVESEPVAGIANTVPPSLAESVVRAASDVAPADEWPDRSGEAMREVASGREDSSAPPIFDAPVVAALGESVILPPPPEPALEIAREPEPERPRPSPPEPVVTPPPVIAVVAEPVVVSDDDPLRAMIAAAVAQPAPAASAPVARTPVPPRVEAPAEDVKARFWGSRTRVSVSAPKPLATTPTPEPVAAPEPPASVVEAVSQRREPEPELTPAPAPLPEPEPAQLAAPAPDPVPVPTAVKVAAPEPASLSAAQVDAARSRASKSRIRMPKQSAVRKAVAKPKPKPQQRDERVDIDVDALIAPLLSEIASKRSAFARTESPASFGETPPANARVEAPAGFGETPSVAAPVSAAGAATATKPSAPGAPNAPDASSASSASHAPNAPSAPVLAEVDPLFFADDALTVPPPTPAQAERSAWIELVESLRQDIERLKAQKAEAAAPPAPAEEKPQSVVAKTVSAIRPRPAAPVVNMPSAASRVARLKPRKPVQDQWGLFDPEQCGFAALLAKLDEIGAREEISA